MKKILFLISIGLMIFCSCSKQLDKMDDSPYVSGTKKLNIQLVYPDKYTSLTRAGVIVKVINPSNGVEYDLTTDAKGTCSADLQYGFYRVSVSDKGVSESGTIPLFNKSIDAVKLKDTTASSINLNVDLVLSYSSQLVIKELYFSGCFNPATKKTYFSDAYMTIYNNSDQVAYLDSLCFGCAEAYNSLSSPSVWSYKDANGQKVIRDTIPITEAVWQWPGTGTTFPVQPGKYAVLVIRGAINHTLVNSNSVDLSKSDYFVCYNSRYTNKTFNPTPSSNLDGHWLDLLWKQGTSTAYAFSINSPTALIFKIQGNTAQGFINDPNNRSRKPGTSSAMEYIMVPSSFVLDAVEVMRSTTEYKRLPASVDASYVLFPPAANSYKGHTVYRIVDEAATAKAGRTILQDTNNSLADFAISDHQLLKDE
ncbi:MAG: DUF4876 domain-containing protein [Bacteroidales bacterium]|nr:DUF4876 domain-containing protein [Bacteroidales bacterium]